MTVVDSLEGWSYPLFPLPPGTVYLLLGDLPVLAFLIFFTLRYTALARANKARGDSHLAALYLCRASLHRRLAFGSIAFTIGSFAVYLTLFIIPSVIVAGPVGGILAVFGFLPYLVWLTPLVAVSADLLVTRKAGLR